jgi:hypothetical protein
MTYADWLQDYVTNRAQQVEGWVDGRLYPSLVVLHEVQTELGIKGGVMEIGVHHGRFFLPLNAMVETGEGPSFALDLFAQQALNIDRSGQGNLQIFQQNLVKHDRHGGANVTCISGDSTRLRHGDLSRYTAVRPKVISIDGGHTVEHTISDLEFAASVIHDSGAIFLDDILNSQWIGVFEGAVTFLQRRPTLWPLLVGYNKLLLVPMSVHGAYLNAFRKRLPATKPVSLCGYPLLSH